MFDMFCILLLQLTVTKHFGLISSLVTEFLKNIFADVRIIFEHCQYHVN